MSKTAVVFTCAHSTPDTSNERFDWLGSLIYDIKPDYVIDLGDFDDMKSLSSHDTRYPKAVVNQSYQKDIEHGQEARERLWHKFRHNKKKIPYRIGFQGNHEYRIDKAIMYDPRLEGEKYGISLKHLQTDYWYDEYNPYQNGAPSLRVYDGVLYGHYVASGNYGTALSGIHHGYALTQKMASSVTVGHSHKFSYYVKQESIPNPIHGLVAGCFKGSEESWAGQANSEWRKGVVIKRNIENGDYDLEWVSLEALRKEYE